MGKIIQLQALALHCYNTTQNAVCDIDQAVMYKRCDLCPVDYHTLDGDLTNWFSRAC